MLDRLASTVMGRRWAFAAAATGLVVGLAIATAPKPSCKCSHNRPERVAWSEPRRAHHGLSLDQPMSARTAYFLLMRARADDRHQDPALAQFIERRLAEVAPRAAVELAALEDWENAASALLVAETAAR